MPLEAIRTRDPFPGVITAPQVSKQGLDVPPLDIGARWPLKDRLQCFVVAGHAQLVIPTIEETIVV